MINSAIAKSVLKRTATVMLVLAMTACATALQKIDQIDPTTADIEATIKAALIDTEQVDAAAILITVKNENEVSLSGFVGSDEESSTAEKVANEAQPNLLITNELVVRQ